MAGRWSASTATTTGARRATPAGFTSDVTVARIKGRFAAAAPVVDKSLRKLTVTRG